MRINESDLATLEEAIPWMLDRCIQLQNNEQFRERVIRVKEILSNVRFGYMPYSSAEVIPLEEPEAP